MNNLWKKKSIEDGTGYVNLLSSTHSWLDIDQERKLMKAYQSLKDNRKSIELRTQGNEKFRSKDWMTAMKFYNRSLCSAETGSENIALAYSNRSACFFPLGDVQ